MLLIYTITQLWNDATVYKKATVGLVDFYGYADIIINDTLRKKTVIEMVTRKKPLIIVLAAVLLVMSVLVFTSCGKEPEPEPTPTPTPAPTPAPTPETSMSHIINRGQLVVAVEAAHPPYIYVKRTNGAFEYCGPEYELAKAVAEDLGVDLVIKDVKADDIYIGLDLGLYDLAVANITPTDEMRLDADFSTEYFKEEYPLMINKEFVGEYTDLNSFKDKRVGCPAADHAVLSC